MNRKYWLTAGGSLAMAITAIAFFVPGKVRTAPAITAPPGLEKIQHFIFIMQENRSFDHYFGTYPGAEGIPSNEGQGPAAAQVVLAHADGSQTVTATAQCDTSGIAILFP